MTTVKTGAVVLDRDKVRVVKDVVYGSVFFEDGTVTRLKWAEIHVSPVQPGDKLRFEGRELQEVIEIQRDLHDNYFQVKYRASNGNRSWSPEYVLNLDTAKKYLVKEEEVTEDKPFPRGSKVRFRNDVTYTAGDWDGELQELVPDDGSETLQFGPDLFELVEGPPVPVGSAARQNQLGHNVLVTENTGDKVRFIRKDGSEGTVSKIYFHENYTVLG